MTGRLRLATMVNLIESFLREALLHEKKLEEEYNPISNGAKGSSPKTLNSVPETGPLYFKASDPCNTHQGTEEEDIYQGIPLSEALSDGNLHLVSFPKLRKMHSLPSVPSSSLSSHNVPSTRLNVRNSPTNIPLEVYTNANQNSFPHPAPSQRERRPLVNRQGMSDLDRSVDDLSMMDYLVVPNAETQAGAQTDMRVVPLIPFDELLLIERIGSGRVSTIYRAAWRQNRSVTNSTTSSAVKLVALKVAMVNPSTSDTSHIDELRGEADIAARLQHPNICDLIGVAADRECFCLAYEFCEGGSLLSLLTDHSRYYEYLPIALDIAQGMHLNHLKL
jgi:Protein tyrosine and serine/threonine kinase